MVMTQHNGPIRLLTVVGARPQFVKAAALSLKISSSFDSQIEEKIVHTGQHFDANMSANFFGELGIPLPAYQLSGPTGSHGVTTGRIMSQLDPILESERPDLVLVFGDTNSTLAAALTAVKQGVPVAHVEAGMRSGNLSMPEEVNRVVTDRISALNLAPSELAMASLEGEGLKETSRLVGDIMFDAVKFFASNARLSERTSTDLGSISDGSKFVLATFHRQENTDSTKKLQEIVAGVLALAEEIPVVLPMHPRLRKKVDELGLLSGKEPGLNILPPVSYLEMLLLQKHAQVVVTDSGGMQKEAFYLESPCVTVRDETEWTETVDLGWNRLISADSSSIVSASLAAINSRGIPGTPYGNGDAASRIVEEILKGSWKSYFSGRQNQ
jgi:UDP-GlcNAc3NAcA epimerase